MPQEHRSAEQERFLPSDIRFALRYREAKLRPGEIALLANEQFENEAAYLLMKCASYDPQLQLLLLRCFVHDIRRVQNPENYTNMRTRCVIRQFVNEHMALIRQDAAVEAGKLAQLSRQGFDFWDELYRASAKKLSLDPRETCVIGYSTFVGLAGYVQTHFASGKMLRLIIPNYVTDQSLSICGYVLMDDVLHLAKDFPRIRPAVLVDDTFRSGSCMRKMKALWSADGAQEPEFEFFAHVDPSATCAS